MDSFDTSAPLDYVARRATSRLVGVPSANLGGVEIIIPQPAGSGGPVRRRRLVQGIKMVIVVLGILYGILTHWRKSLRPAMIAHAWQDIASLIAI
jgi:hypothetical protein